MIDFFTKELVQAFNEKSAAAVISIISSLCKIGDEPIDEDNTRNFIIEKVKYSEELLEALQEAKFSFGGANGEAVVELLDFVYTDLETDVENG